MIQGESLHIEVFHLKSHVKITLFKQGNIHRFRESGNGCVSGALQAAQPAP